MRIKRLELCGFKSFVEPTTLEFSPGVSGVVGPNGCGKSNIVDALRWLLGEQSALRLRGEAMEDVIFNGNAKGRAPAGMAEVSLLLENESPPDDGAELAEIYGAIRDLPEILVTRRYFRSGESEYEINRRPCRLKDITELFLGTGVGSKAYAIVEQGRVNQLVEARAEDVRLFIEEAAGTTLYRSRRLAAERKLERTRANLAIASERLQEKEKTIAWLRRMARRAEQYRALQEELRRVELQVVRRQYDRLVADVRTLEEERDALSARERDLAASVVTREEERVAARDALAAAEAELRERQEALYAVRGTRERAEARLEMLEREQREIVDRLGRIGREAEQAISGTAALVAELAEREAQLRTSESERATREGALADSLAAVQAEDARVAEIAGELETAKVEVQECLRGEAELRNEIAAAERLAGDRARRRDGIAAELARLGAELARLETEAGRLAGERALVEARLGESEAAASRAETDLAAARAERGRLAEAHRRASAVLAECESHLAALEEVERSYGRYHEGPRAVMRRHAASPNGVLNLVAEVLEAPPEYEKAVAAVLGERLQSVVVRTPEDARAAIEELKLEEAGRSSFVPLEPRTSGRMPAAVERPEGVLASLAEVVRVEEGFGELARWLLEDAVVVRDLDTGIALWRRNGVARTLVTLDGDVLHPNGVLSGGSGGPQEEPLLAKRREIRRLAESVERARLETSALGGALAAAEDRVSTLERTVATLDERRAALALDRLTLTKDAERATDAVSRRSEEIAHQRAEREALDGELRDLAREIEERRGTVALSNEARAEREEERRRLDAELASRRAALGSRADAATELKVSLAQMREKEEGLREALRTLDRQRRELERRVDELSAERGQLERRGGEAEAESLALRESVTSDRELEERRAVGLEESRAAAERLGADIRRAETDLATLRSSLDESRVLRSERERDLVERSVRRDTLTATTEERYAVSPEAVELEEGDASVLEARFEELRHKVERLDRGAVGAEAASELAELEAERDRLAAQKADLEAGIADLERTIGGLNRASRDRFAETFAAVNEKFQELFPKLFHGGLARLVLTDEKNLLESGVDIEAQPPGMNLRTLSLLSGGQKALTAVSLIFALFLCRPSPFCVLDEVDAPLDDANIDRFNEMVREMGRASQFILITHNKRTMEVADTLYGVTMEDPGVSRIYSARFQDL